MLGRQNRGERRGNRDLLAWKPAEALAAFGQASAAIEDIRDDTPEAVRRKSALFRARLNDPDWVRRKGGLRFVDRRVLSATATGRAGHHLERCAGPAAGPAGAARK